MRVAHISKADRSGGGASRVAQELTEAMRLRGLAVEQWTALPSRGSGAAQRRHVAGPFAPVWRAVCGLQRRVGLPEPLALELPLLLRPSGLLRAELLHFHDISGALSPLTLALLARFRPVVWTFHDCSPFTGGCLYPVDCRRYRRGCGACPGLGTWPLDGRLDCTAISVALKRAVHRRCGLVPVAPSNWMADLAWGSGLLSCRPHVIPNGVRTDIFRPQNRARLRAKLGWPRDRTVVLLSATDLASARKGAREALMALHHLGAGRPHLVLVGRPTARALRAHEELLAPLAHDLTGYVDEPALLAELYAAADLLLLPSLADNQPLTALEALACGTPVVAFRVGGLSEVVPDGKAGILVEPGDVVAFARAVQVACRALTGPTARRCARSFALTHFDQARMVDDHLGLYKKLLGLPRGEHDDPESGSTSHGRGQPPPRAE